MLASRFRLLDDRRHVLHLDDDYRESSQQQRLRARSLSTQPIFVMTSSKMRFLLLFNFLLLLLLPCTEAHSPWTRLLIESSHYTLDEFE
jgi:hypothetical protein